MAQMVYFPGLNGLRFIAAFLVIITHSESIRRKLGFTNFAELSIAQNGGFAVQFFFVLSGFLISYLLFQEHRNSNTISIKNFYLRRVLRIWPLYYLIAIIGLYVLPYFVLPMMRQTFHAEYDILTGSFLFLLFLPNLANSFFETHHLHSLWSIGVEEQFYLVWAPVVKFFKKYFIPICLGIIMVKITLLWYATTYYPGLWQTKFLSSLQFECMAIGGLGAYWYFHGGQIEGNFIFSKVTQLIVFGLLASWIFAYRSLSEDSTLLGQLWQFFFRTPLYGIVTNLLFLHVILNVSKNPSCIINLDNRVMNFLGDISYGLYMYHPLVVHFVIKAVAKKILFLPAWAYLISMYGITISLLIVVCYLSFRYFEQPILRLRRHF